MHEDPDCDDEHEFRVCDHCGEMRCCRYQYDPYLNEIDDKKEYSWWCDECFDTRRGDI